MTSAWCDTHEQSCRECGCEAPAPRSSPNELKNRIMRLPAAEQLRLAAQLLEAGKPDIAKEVAVLAVAKIGGS